MSVTYQLYQYEDSMSDEVLQSMGVLGGALGQLSADVDYERETELLKSADDVVVGDSLHDFPTRVNDAIEGLQSVDGTLIEIVRAAREEYADDEEGRYDAERVLEWLEEREGEEVFILAL